jgi:succinoglycan biosynthesis transport protein ExoP
MKALLVTDHSRDGDIPIQFQYNKMDQHEGEIDLYKLVLIVKRRWKFMLLGALTGLGLGIAYASTTTRLYSASVQLSLDAREATNARELTGLQTFGMSESEITTEIEIIKSVAVSEKVVERLSLTQNIAFMQTPQTGLSRLKSLLKAPVAPILNMVAQVSPEVPTLPIFEREQQDAAKFAAISRLRNNMAVTRLRDSRVIDIRMTASSPTLSATVANAIADTYIEDQLESKFNATQRATDWLKERSDQLRDQSVQLDEEIAQFKRENGLVGVDNQEASNEEFDNVSQQLSVARSQLVNQQAQQRFLAEIIETGDTSIAVSSTSDQSITSGLRSRYLDGLKDYNSLVSRLGLEHEQTMRRKSELDQLQVLLFEEIKRSEEIARNELNVTLRRIDQLEESLSEAETELGVDRELLVEVRELEREAGTTRSLYASFLQKYQQSKQEQSFTVSNVRILNPAKVPGGASYPDTSRIMLLSVLLGLMATTALAGLVELWDKNVRTGEQLQSALGIEFIGGLEEITDSKKVLRIRGRDTTLLEPISMSFPDILIYGVNKPLSGFAETLRAIKMSIKLKPGAAVASKTSKVVGIISAFPAEGKTTTGANLANFLASQGHKVILIDADLRNPGLTKALSCTIESGLVDILQGEVEWRQAIHIDAKTGLHVIANKQGRVIHTSELIASEDMNQLMQALREHYEFIILDLPPLGPVIDARSALPLMDGFVLVTKWGQTNITHLERLLSTDPRLREKCYGAVLNFFDARRARSYGYYAGDYYYRYAYKRYYSDQ